MHLISLIFCFFAFAQFPPHPPQPDDPPADTRLPNGKSQRDEILKADHAKNLDDARELVRLAEQLQAELEKNTHFVFSLAAVKKTEEIEKTAHRIRSRMKRN